MRGFRIIHHTEKVGGRRKERTVWDRVCRSPEGALGEESIANTSTTTNRCFAWSATTRPFIGQRPRISFGITSIRFPKTLRCVSKFGRSSRSPPMQKQARYGSKAGQPNPRFLLNVESTPTTSKRKSTISNGRVRPQTLLRWSHQAPRREHRSALPSQRKKAGRKRGREGPVLHPHLLGITL